MVSSKAKYRYQQRWVLLENDETLNIACLHTSRNIRPYKLHARTFTSLRKPDLLLFQALLNKLIQSFHLSNYRMLLSCHISSFQLWETKWYLNLQNDSGGDFPWVKVFISISQSISSLSLVFAWILSDSDPNSDPIGLEAAN